MKNWNNSYSYTKSYKNSTEMVHKSNKKIFKDEYIITQNNELKDKFYKRGIDQISKNEDLDLLEQQENKKHKYIDIDISNKYLERPSSRHRLANSIQYKNKEFKINNNLIEFNSEERLNNMMKEMNLSIFNNNF